MTSRAPTLSGLGLVARCPGSWSLPRQARATGPAAALGRAIHEMIEARIKVPGYPLPEGIADIYDLSPDDAGRLTFLAQHLRLPVPPGAMSEVSLALWANGSVRRIGGGAGVYPDEGQILSGQLDLMWAEPFGFVLAGYPIPSTACPTDSTLWVVDWKTGDEDNVPPPERNWQLRGGALMAARWTGATRVIPAVCYVNAAECAAWLREHPGEAYEGRWETGAPLDAAALDAIEVELCAVLARARGEDDGQVEADASYYSDRQRGDGEDVSEGRVSPCAVMGSGGEGEALYDVASTRDRRAPLILGPHCEHCPARGVCPAIAAEAVSLARAEGETRRIIAFMGMDQSWPTHDVLARLADAADHLLSDHSCDVHGHEEIAIARDVARARLAALMAPPNDGLYLPPGGALTTAAASYLAGMLGPARRLLDAAEEAVRAHVRAHGPLQLADGRELAPELEPVTRYRTAPTFEALASVVGDERANDAFEATAASLKRALEGQESGAWRRLRAEIEARGGVVPGVREVWRRRWPVKPAEVSDGRCGDPGDRAARDGGDSDGERAAGDAGCVLSSPESPTVSGREPHAGDGRVADPSGNPAGVETDGVMMITRAPCSKCGRPYALVGRQFFRVIRSHQQPGGGLRCEGSGLPPAQTTIPGAS